MLPVNRESISALKKYFPSNFQKFNFVTDAVNVNEVEIKKAAFEQENADEFDKYKRDRKSVV